jgi:predicted chitinase
MQSSSQTEISLCTSRAITRAINGNHKGNQWQSQGQSMAITRAINGNHEGNQWQSRGQSMAITRAIKGNHEGSQGSVVERITGDQEQ